MGDCPPPGPPAGGSPAGGALGADSAFADFSATPIVMAIVIPPAGSPVTVANSASQPSPKTLSDCRDTSDKLLTLFAYPVS
jgi:hypothetical protein